MSSKHLDNLVNMATDHFEDLKVFDRVKVVHVLKEILEDPEKVVEQLTDMIYSARIESYELGINPMRAAVKEFNVEGPKEKSA
jgi:6-phosphogluconate dehydrogenase